MKTDTLSYIAFNIGPICVFVCVCVCLCMLACARVHVCETTDTNLTRNKATFGKFCNGMLIKTLL